MTTPEDIESLLRALRQRFVDELPEKCDAMERLLLSVESCGRGAAEFDELFRIVHSLKGSGGTHGLGIVTAICHGFEDHLADLAADGGVNRDYVSRGLAFIDLLRRVAEAATDPLSDLAALQAPLDCLLQAPRRKVCLILEPSASMVNLYRAALAALDLDCVVASDGARMAALLRQQRVDLVIVGGESALGAQGDGMAALLEARASPQAAPVILVTTSPDKVVHADAFDVIVRRDKTLVATLPPVVGKLLGV